MPPILAHSLLLGPPNAGSSRCGPVEQTVAAGGLRVIAFTGVAATALIVAALLLATGEPKVGLVKQGGGV